VARVEVGGKLSNRKGISLPDTTVPFSALTAKDRSDLEAALDADIDWVALSFIQRPEDVAEAKKITRGRAAVMAKIEKPQAVSRLADILDLVDALMVARGDLGVEMPLEKVPGVQKQITRLTRRAGKPVVVATQMLESMITNPVPTRAEVSDVATAVRMARRRPKSPIIAISPNLATGRKLSLAWGVHCVIAQDARDLDDVVDRACRMAVRDGFAKIGQRIIIVAGVPLGLPGATNMVRIAFVSDEAAESVPLFQTPEEMRQRTGV